MPTPSTESDLMEAALHDRSPYGRLMLADWYYEQGQPDLSLAWRYAARKEPVVHVSKKLAWMLRKNSGALSRTGSSLACGLVEDNRGWDFKKYLKGSLPAQVFLHLEKDWYQWKNQGCRYGARYYESHEDALTALYHVVLKVIREGRPG